MLPFMEHSNGCWHDYDAIGGFREVASPSEWGCDMTAAGFPASPGVLSPPSEDALRHNFLLRRQISDPGYGRLRELSWREKARRGLMADSLPSVPLCPARVPVGVIAVELVRKGKSPAEAGPSPSEP